MHSTFCVTQTASGGQQSSKSRAKPFSDNSTDPFWQANSQAKLKFFQFDENSGSVTIGATHDHCIF
jgi:hypothetical protein